MANTKDELRVSNNFVNLIQENEGLFYKTLNRLFNIENFSELMKFSPKDVKLEKTFEDVGRMDILIENHNYFLIIENKVHSQTGTQETQTSLYFNLMKRKEKEGKKTFICYLINNGHPEDEFVPAVKKHSNNSKIDYWNDLIKYLYETADFAERKNIEYFVLYSKDEIDNFTVEIDGSEKIFGADVELFSNPFLLSTINNYFCDSEIEVWIRESFVLPALKRVDGVINPQIKNDSWNFIVFNYKNIEYWMNLTMFWNSKLNTWCYKNSFTFYKPWIVGCREATTEEQMIEYTKRAIEEWLSDEDAQSNSLSINEDGDIVGKEEINFQRIFGSDVEIFSNPWLLANTNWVFTNKKPRKKTLENPWLFDNIIVPAVNLLKTNLSKIEKKEYYREIYVEFVYKGIEFHVGFGGFYDTFTNKEHTCNSFTFYRPWIIGCRYARSEKEMIEYTKKAIEMWLKDVDIELGLS